MCSEEHALVNEAELKYVRGVDEKGNAKLADVAKKPKVPWSMMLKSPNMWAIMLAYFTYVYCLWIFLSWLPSYLVEYRHFTLLKVGFLASLPLVAGVVGDTVGGLTTDWLLAKTANIKFSRRVVAITVYCLTASMFFLECTIGPSWAVPMDIGGEVSGTVSGMMNMAGNFGGALSPIVFGVLVQFGSWQAPFIVAASLLVLGAAIWGFWLDLKYLGCRKSHCLSAASLAAGCSLSRSVQKDAATSFVMPAMFKRDPL
jgi:sugar phosphate permease